MKPYLKRNPRITAHRGSSGTCPENTEIAFKAAIESRADVIETDCHLTKDEQIVLWHDDTIKDKEGNLHVINTLKYKELQQFDAAWHFRDKDGQYSFRGRDIKVPLMENVLKNFPESYFNIDMKDNTDILVKNFSDIIRRQDAINRVLAASFHNRNVYIIRKLIPEMATCCTPEEIKKFLLFHYCKLSYLKPASMGDAWQVPEKYGIISLTSESLINHLHSLEIPVHVWTINDRNIMKRLLANGADAIVTDHPEILRNLITGS